MAKESWGTPTAMGTTVTTASSVTSALVLEARASEARLLLALKKRGGGVHYFKVLLYN